MPQSRLTGLKSGMPIGFMAALGAFRRAAEMTEPGGAKLGWVSHGGEWCASLEIGKSIEPADLAKLSEERLKSLKNRPEFEWSKVLKDLSPEAFRNGSESVIGDERLAAWFQAFGSELATTKDDKLQPTPFDMTVARQLFLADAAELTKELGTPDKKRGDAQNVASFHEALFGPWKYKDDQHSLGWDPSTILMGAFTPKAPTSMTKAGVRAAVWLAMESLPFFPCFHNGQFATTGFLREGRTDTFKWPIWESPLTLPAVRTVIQHAVALDETELAQRGIAAVYTADVFKPNKYLTSFQPAILAMIATERNL